MTWRVRQVCACIALLCCAPAIAYSQTSTSTAANIQQQIDAHNAQISQLDAEIAQYQVQLTETSAKKQTLQTQLDQLNLNVKKTTASISRTQNQISATELQIQQLASGITKAEGTIQDQQQGLAESLRALSEEESQPLIVQILADGNISQVWNDISASQSLQSAINAQIQTLVSTKKTLTDTKSAAEAKQAELLKQKATLLTQQGSLSAQKRAQSELLAETKSQESTYQAIISQKRAQEASLQAALSDLKAQYNQAVNPSQITAPGRGILQWPIAGNILITQYFGDTPFAQANSALYSGHGHDGLDIAAPIGTPIMAALGGTVLATGNTDAVRGCYSFGKWVMVKHNNGISTMYAHLSQIGVAQGESVATGDLLGYSGETGYATGPHLHFGVYVSAVTKIIPLGQATNSRTPCSNAVMPVPPLSGYLNPLNYLPAGYSALPGA